MRRVKCNNCDSVLDENRVIHNFDSEQCPVCRAKGCIADVEQFTFKELSTVSPRDKALEWFKSTTGDYKGLSDDKIIADLTSFGSNADDYKYYEDGSPVPEEAR